MIRIQLSDEELKKIVKELAERSKDSISDGSDDKELQDVVDSDDKVIGSLPRGVIWDNGIQGQTRVVNVFVSDMEGNILLPVRSKKKSYLPGGYDFSCGENLQAGEEYTHAVVRGLKEELNIEEVPKYLASFVPDSRRNLFCFGKVYFVKVANRSDISTFNTEEIERLEWRSRREILDMLDDYPDKFKADYKAIFKMAFG